MGSERPEKMSVAKIHRTDLPSLESSQANHEIDDVTGRLEMHFLQPYRLVLEVKDLKKC
jgi:hypothetical protein